MQVKEDQYLAGLTSESINPNTSRIDECDTEGILRLLNSEDQGVPLAVEKEIPQITQAVDLIVERIRAGGRLFYVGCGTSGRLGVLDASECPPTYGTSPELVQGYIAGGDTALRNAVEGSEDNAQEGAELMETIGVTNKDAVVGITASGSAPYVLGAIVKAREIGAAAIGLATNQNSKLARICDVTIAPVVGPEPIMGSTRMKSGTAQKLVLNMISTSVMIRLGKVYNNLMVDLRASNNKLLDRSMRIIRQVCGCTTEEAAAALNEADMSVKLAILMLKSGLGADDARSLLDSVGGRLKDAISHGKE